MRKYLHKKTHNLSESVDFPVLQHGRQGFRPRNPYVSEHSYLHVILSPHSFRNLLAWELT
jgi:hypothetical protein